MIISLLLLPICSIANRARGSKFWEHISSTVLTRLAAMGIIALSVTAFTSNLILFPVILAGLMLWCTPAWDKYWSAQIGNDLPAVSKAWGNRHMFVRQLLILPTFAATIYFYNTPWAWGALYAIPALLYWLPYYVFGFFTKSESIARAEYTIGALIGLSFYLIIGQEIL